jgi:hypothetical protein
MAGRHTSARRPLVQAQTPKVADAHTQRALDVVDQAVRDLQARRHLEQFTATEPGYVPASGGSATDFLAADGVWKTIVGAGLVDSVAAGSTMVSVSSATGNIVIDVVPANFTGIPMAGVVFVGTDDRLVKFSSSTLADTTISDTGSLVTINNALTVTGAATLSTMTAGSVLFAGTAGLVSQDNANLFWNNTDNRLGVGTATPAASLHIEDGPSGAAAPPSTAGLIVDRNDHSHVTISGPTGAEKGVLFGNPTSATDGAILYDNTSAARGMQLHAAGASRVAINAGSVIFGEDTFANTKTFTGVGDVEMTKTGSNGGFTVSSYGTGVTSVLALYSGRGTPASTAALVSTNQLGGIAFTGSTGAAANHFFASCQINATATENWSSASNFGGKLEFLTTTNAAGAGGRAVRLTIDHNGNATFAQALTCNGNLTAGDSTSVDLHTFNGTRIGTNTLGTRSCLGATQTPSGGTTNATSAVVAANNGTYNTTGAVQSQYSLRAVSSSTRSAGANALTNVAVYGSASGAQVNVALRTDAGNVLLNQTGGTFSCDGAATFTSTLDATGNFAVNTNKFTVAASTGNTVVAGTLSVTGAITENGVAVLAGAITADTIPKGSGGNLADSAITDDGSTVTIAAGHTAHFAGAPSGFNTVTITPPAGGGGVALSINDTATGQIDNSHNINSRITGSYDTTAGGLFVIAVEAITSSTRSAGGNSLTNIGLYSEASGAQVNYGLWVGAGLTRLDGAVTINSSLDVTGTTTLGDAITDTHTINGALTVNGPTGNTNGMSFVNSFAGQTGNNHGVDVAYSGTYDTTAGQLFPIGIQSVVSATRSAGGNSLNNIALYAEASGADVNYGLWVATGITRLDGNVLLGDSTSADAHTIKGSINANNVPSSEPISYQFNSAPSGIATDTRAVQLLAGGSLDCTAGNRTSYGGFFQSGATKSAGANLAINIAGYFNAVSGDINRAIQTDAGDNIFNLASGSSVFIRDVEIQGNSRIGNESSDTVGFYTTAGAAQQTVTGSRGGNAALADLLTKLATLGLIVDSTS